MLELIALRLKLVDCRARVTDNAGEGVLGCLDLGRDVLQRLTVYVKLGAGICETAGRWWFGVGR